MRILFAASDRDLLDSYQKLLSSAFGECVTAFDGTQVLAALAGTRFDMVILDPDLPRVRQADLLREFDDKGLPSIVLLDSPVTAHRLSADPLPSAFLSHPFLPDDLIGLMQNVLCKAASREHFSAGGIDVDVSAFRMDGRVRLTAIEIDLLYTLANPAPDEHPGASGLGAAVSALNEKLLSIKAPVFIRYRPKKGFELVEIHE